MRLLITTPTAVVLDDPDVVGVRAEDESGSFGILSGHADFLTALTVSMVSWPAPMSVGDSAPCAMAFCRSRTATKWRSRRAKPSEAMISIISNRWCWQGSGNHSKPSGSRGLKVSNCR